jgi:hypothetical protein
MNSFRPLVYSSTVRNASGQLCRGSGLVQWQITDPCTLDGESCGDRLVIFDLLAYGGHDLRCYPGDRRGRPRPVNKQTRAVTPRIAGIGKLDGVTIRFYGNPRH